MISSPDPLFRNGLENYRKAAPASVWDRVEAGLERKRRKSVWLKVAAGLFLMIATSVSLVQFNQTDTSVEAVSENTSAHTMKPVETIAESYQPSAINYQSPVVESFKPTQSNSIVERSRNNHPNVVPEGLPVVERSRNDLGRRSQQLAVGSQKSVNTLNDIQPITLTEPEEINTEVTPLISIDGSGNDVIVEQKGTSITYTADQVNSRFIKKEKVLEATPAKKNTSGLQKVIDKALDLTNEGTVYGELREKKNEWLSFNMLSNKTEANK